MLFFGDEAKADRLRGATIVLVSPPSTRKLLQSLRHRQEHTFLEHTGSCRCRHRDRPSPMPARRDVSRSTAYIVLSGHFCLLLEAQRAPATDCRRPCAWPGCLRRFQPAVSLANVGELALDVLVTSLGPLAHVGSLEDANVMPCVGNDAFDAGPGALPGALSTALELYCLDHEGGPGRAAAGAQGQDGRMDGRGRGAMRARVRTSRIYICMCYCDGACGVPGHKKGGGACSWPQSRCQMARGGGASVRHRREQRSHSVLLRVCAVAAVQGRPQRATQHRRPRRRCFSCNSVRLRCGGARRRSRRRWPAGCRSAGWRTWCCCAGWTGGSCGGTSSCSSSRGCSRPGRRGRGGWRRGLWFGGVGRGSSAGHGQGARGGGDADGRCCQSCRACADGAVGAVRAARRGSCLSHPPSY